jgi:flagellar basal-body rod modification protein FlgD
MTTTTSATGANNINDLMATMNAKPAASTDPNSVSAQTDKFMTLLVTQLKNQDPLNPMDNAQLTSQLAQLSTVQGINQLNSTLTSLSSSYQSTESLAATNLIGKGVLVDGNSVGLSSGQGVFGVELGTAADSVQVQIFDAKGNQVQAMDLGAQPAGVLPVAWNGVPDATNVDANGKPVTLPDGSYTIKVTATAGGSTLTDASALTLSSVASVTTNAKDGVKLNLPGKGMVSLADIKQVL